MSYDIDALEGGRKMQIYKLINIRTILAFLNLLSNTFRWGDYLMNYELKSDAAWLSVCASMLTSRKSLCRNKHVSATNEQNRSSLLNLLRWSSFTSSLFIRLSVWSLLLNELSVLSQTAGTLLKVVQVWCPFGSAADVSFPLLTTRRVLANGVLFSCCAPWPARCTLTESGIFVLIYSKLFVLFVGQTTQAFWTHRSSQLLHLKHSCIEFSVVSSQQFEICVP